MILRVRQERIPTILTSKPSLILLAVCVSMVCPAPVVLIVGGAGGDGRRRRSQQWVDA